MLQPPVQGLVFEVVVVVLVVNSHAFLVVGRHNGRYFVHEPLTLSLLILVFEEFDPSGDEHLCEGHAQSGKVPNVDHLQVRGLQ